ncbi:hypothetical protein L3X38_004044 [Prunus dulcis]|uniref:Uncharacterized protein n=1 Tax=Prunus dulcis TaxID=3755 RepID=A0AAD5F2V5_PRUDU|nr:hypothetical protein L3X38_004042 [Prunus dulcis]KAI5351153.1 hypothetical protein L3X38_004044 [Prunus dulcis]
MFTSRFVRPSEWAELQLPQFERDRSGYSRWSDELGIALRELFCLGRTLHDFAKVSMSVKDSKLCLSWLFAEPNL